jgi:hypothetical protein
MFQFHFFLLNLKMLDGTPTEVLTLERLVFEAVDFALATHIFQSLFGNHICKYCPYLLSFYLAASYISCIVQYSRVLSYTVSKTFLCQSCLNQCSESRSGGSITNWPSGSWSGSRNSEIWIRGSGLVKIRIFTILSKMRNKKNQYFINFNVYN